MPRPSTPLTAIQCKNARPDPEKKVTKLYDRDGLLLRVTGPGRGSWQLKYRWGKKEKTLSLGVYPTVSLSDARDETSKARKKLADGLDPGVEKKQRKISAIKNSEDTFKAVALEWLDEAAKNAKWSPHYKDKVLRSLVNDLFGPLGSLPIGQISAQEMNAVLTKVTARGALETASRLKQRCTLIFDHAVAESRASNNPMYHLKAKFKAPKATHQPRIAFFELPAFWKSIPAANGHRQTELAIMMMAYTFLRTKELRHLRWEYIDPQEKCIRIPGEIMKQRCTHLVPISRQVQSLIDELRTFNYDSPFLFRSERSAFRPMSNNTVLYAIYRMGYKGLMSGHGFRSVASTELNELKSNREAIKRQVDYEVMFDGDVIERQLDHKERDQSRDPYNEAEYWESRVYMMQTWADHLDDVVSGKKKPRGLVRLRVAA